MRLPCRMRAPCQDHQAVWARTTSDWLSWPCARCSGAALEEPCRRRPGISTRRSIDHGANCGCAALAEIASAYRPSRSPLLARRSHRQLSRISVWAERQKEALRPAFAADQRAVGSAKVAAGSAVWPLRAVD